LLATGVIRRNGTAPDEFAKEVDGRIGHDLARVCNIVVTLGH
jgi:hypothetical protein